NEFLKLSFDSENKVLKAVSNGEVANRFIGGKYAEITHFDKEGNVKGTYSIRGGETADNLANSLNNLEYVEGDSLKFFHGEQNSRLAIKGYINNLDIDLSNGVGNFDLNNTKFKLDDENLTYMNS
ncbi:MAG: putative mucin/carbohydrate-binding domain-containing protein, partial [Clostridium sp.]